MSLPSGTIGVAYKETLTATGGDGSYIWALLNGTELPTGLSLAATSEISGTPTAAGTVVVTVEVTSAGQTVEKNLSITVHALLNISSTTPLPGGTIGVAYEETLTATGGDGTFTWALKAGSPDLPAGLVLGADGVISGTPTAAGTVVVTVEVTSAGQTVEKNLSITVHALLNISSTTPLPGGTIGVAYEETLTATGGDGTFTWALKAGSPDLPAGLVLGADGVISGTPTAAGTVVVTVEVTSAGQTVEKNLSITVHALLNISSTTPLPGGTIGVAYEETLTATGGDGTFTWALKAGSPDLPAGLVLGADGVISGTPTAAGTVVVTVEVTSAGQTVEKNLSITVHALLNISSTTPLPGGTIGVAYEETLTATGGDGTFTWALKAGSPDLPAGLVLGADGVISGTPTAAGTVVVTVEVTSAGQTVEKNLSITVHALLNISSTTPLPGGTIGVAYEETLTATGGDGSYTWALFNGTELPTGLSLAATGEISGTPTGGGTAVFELNVTSGGQSATKAFVIIVADAPMITTASPMPNGTIGTVYSRTMTATGGDGMYNWSLSEGSSLPPGLTLNGATGEISGALTATGTTVFEVQVLSGGGTATKMLSITVNDPPSITSSSLPGITVDNAYSQTLAASGGDGDYTWAMFSGTLPTGLVLDPSGQIHGTPTEAGTTSFEVQVESDGLTVKATLSITIFPAGGPAPILEVDFESYGNTAELLSDCQATGGTWNCNEDFATTNIIVDPAVAPPIAGLTKSMRYAYIHDGNGCNSRTVSRQVDFPNEQEVWAEFYVRWSANFTTSNAACAPNDHKLIFGDTWGGLSGRWGLLVGEGSPPFHVVKVERPLSPTEGMLGSYNPNVQTIAANGNLWDGNWHIIRLHYRHSTTTSSNDGAMKLWIDGTLHHDEFGFNTTTEGTPGEPDFLEGFTIGSTKNDGPPGIEMFIWWGRIQVYTSDPGPSLPTYVRHGTPKNWRLYT